jgi:FlaA1/EpsC-like NDP-sugar epimerase
MRTNATLSAADSRARIWPAWIALRVKRDVPLAALDFAVLATSYLVALVLRFDGAVPPDRWSSFIRFLPLLALIQLAVNHLLGLYGQMWRYASVHEAIRVVVAGTAAGVIVAGIELADAWLHRLPLSVVVSGAILSMIGMGAIRFQSRLFALRRSAIAWAPRRVLVVGAGDAGEMVLKDILRNASMGLEPIGLVDDDLGKVGRTMHRVRVLGRLADIASLVSSHRVEEVLFAIPSAASDVIRGVAAQCEAADVVLRVLPSVHEIVQGRVGARDIRDLRIEDLLGRRQVVTDLNAVASILTGRRVLITGAGGSIGSEIARQVQRFEPAALFLLDHDETHLHDLVSALDQPDVVSVLGDVRDQARILSTFLNHRPDVVFHAAAHKHVPLLESHPEEAFMTNVLGTANVVDAAAISGVERLVLISTDKAVRPVSIMGASKWFAEQIVQSAQDEWFVRCAVRFGNVLGSRGSVIPTFFRQIARGGPVTVTDPAMLRYFMSIPEAVQLVLQAAAMATGGEVFTLDMGEPVSVLELARNVIRLSGRVPGRDIQIEITGPRPGERLLEELVAPGENVEESSHPDILVSRPAPPDPVKLRKSLMELEGLIREARSEEMGERLRMMWVDPKQVIDRKPVMATSIQS